MTLLNQAPMRAAGLDLCEFTWGMSETSKTAPTPRPKAATSHWKIWACLKSKDPKNLLNMLQFEKEKSQFAVELLIFGHTLDFAGTVHTNQFFCVKNSVMPHDSLYLPVIVIQHCFGHKVKGCKGGHLFVKHLGSHLCYLKPQTKTAKQIEKMSRASNPWVISDHPNTLGVELPPLLKSFL